MLGCIEQKKSTVPDPVATIVALCPLDRFPVSQPPGAGVGEVPDLIR